MSLDGLPRVAASDVPAATAAQMAEVDRIASAELGIPLEVLMENAGRQVAAATRAFLGGASRRRIVAIAGTGNNGGDALAALRHLQGWGAQVEAYVAGPRDRLRPLAALQYDILERLGIPLHDTATLDDGALVEDLRGADIMVDGLLGYSTRGAPHGETRRLIAVGSAARSGGARPIIAVDLPSGLDPASGESLGERPSGAITAALTVTLALPKPGLLRDIARHYVGELVLADVGIPPAAFERVGIDTRTLFECGDLLRIGSSAAPR